MAPRFIFPNAPVRPVTVNNGMPMRAWYDIYSLSIRDREDAAGIRESAAAVHGLIDRERAAGISAERIVLAGFSQGGAVALQAGRALSAGLAGILALSTYLPLRATLAAEAIPANRPIPILMCHGRQDPIVPLDLARQSFDALKPRALRRAGSSTHATPAVRARGLDISQWLVQVCPRFRGGPAQFAQQLLGEVAGGNRALLHELQVEALLGELRPEQPLRPMPQGQDLLLAQPVGDGLGGPARIALDFAARALTAGAFARIASALGSRQEPGMKSTTSEYWVTASSKDMRPVWMAGIDAHAQVPQQLTLQLIQTLLR